MNSQKLKQMYGSTPKHFEQRIALTLQRAEQHRKKKAKVVRVIWVTALLTVLMTAVAYAVFSSQAVSYFSRLYGEGFGAWLHQGNVDIVGESYEMNDVIYTIDEVIYRENALYGVGTIRAKEGAPILLIPEEFPIDKPYGYDIYGVELSGEISADAPSVAQLAKEQGKQVMMVQVIPERMSIADGEDLPIGCVGYTLATTEDGTIAFSFEIVDGIGYTIEESMTYTIDLYIAVSETEEGIPDFDTRKSDYWTFDVKPTMVYPELTVQPEATPASTLSEPVDLPETEQLHQLNGKWNMNQWNF